MATVSPQNTQIKDFLIPLDEKTRMGIYIKSIQSEKVRMFLLFLSACSISRLMLKTRQNNQVQDQAHRR